MKGAAMICVNMKHAFAHHPFFVSSADAAHPMALLFELVFFSPLRVRARNNASTNHGKPAVVATARLGALTSPDVIKAKATDAPVTPPPAKGAVVPAKKPQKTPEKVELKTEPTVEKPAKVAEPTPSVRKPKVPGPALQKPKPDKPKCGQPHEPACH
jgi:outer membrane biosynthesis protein TonB